MATQSGMRMLKYGYMETEHDPIVCYCLAKRKSEVLCAWRNGDCADVRELMKKTRVGTVCTACRSTVEHIVSNTTPEQLAALTCAPLPTIYTNRNQQLSPYKKIRRWARSMRDTYLRPGVKNITYHCMYRNDNGFESEIGMVNVVNNDFPGNKSDVTYHITLYDNNGSRIGDVKGCLKCGENAVVKVKEHVGAEKTYGLAEVTFTPNSWRGRLKARTGSLRPYVTHMKNGLPATIHEKSVAFDVAHELPGIAAHAHTQTELAIANLHDTPNMVRVTCGNTTGTHVHEVTLAPYASTTVALCANVHMQPTQWVNLTTQKGISGYQFIYNTLSAHYAVQHLVKEGG